MEPTLAFLVDWIHSQARGRVYAALHSIKALRFVSKKMMLNRLCDLLFSDLVKAYSVPTEAAERRETAPLPLSFVVYLERVVIDGNQSVLRRLQCGFMLLAIGPA